MDEFSAGRQQPAKTFQPWSACSSLYGGGGPSPNSSNSKKEDFLNRDGRNRIKTGTFDAFFFLFGRSLLSLVGSPKMKLTPRILRCHIGVMIHWVRTGGSVDVGKLVVAVTRWSLGLS